MAKNGDKEKGSKVVQENLNDVVVEAENQFDFSKLKYEDIKEDKKVEVFEQMKKANVMMMSMLSGCEQQMKALEEKAKGKVSDETYMRLMADYDNFKRRNASARSEGYNEGQDEVLLSMIEIADNFDRAIPMIQDESVLGGVKMIYKQICDKLSSFNVKEIDCLNKAFDADLHNAVMQGTAQSEDQIDTVMEVLQKGYIKGSKVLRHSYVKVAK